MAIEETVQQLSHEVSMAVVQSQIRELTTSLGEVVGQTLLEHDTNIAVSALMSLAGSIMLHTLDDDRLAAMIDNMVGALYLLPGMRK